MALDWPVQAHNLQTCYRREAHCSFANVNSPMDIAKLESGKRSYLGKVMLDGCDQERISLSTLIGYSCIDVKNFMKKLGAQSMSRYVWLGKWNEDMLTATQPR